MSAKRARQLSTLRRLRIFVPVAQDIQRAKAAVSESRGPQRDLKASLASLHDKRERRCQSTSVALPGSLFLVIHPHIVRQLLVSSSGTDLLTPSRASGSAAWLATPSWLCRCWASAQIAVSCGSHDRLQPGRDRIGLGGIIPAYVGAPPIKWRWTGLAKLSPERLLLAHKLSTQSHTCSKM